MGLRCRNARSCMARRPNIVRGVATGLDSSSPCTRSTSSTYVIRYPSRINFVSFGNYKALAGEGLVQGLFHLAGQGVRPHRRRGPRRTCRSSPTGMRRL